MYRQSLRPQGKAYLSAHNSTHSQQQHRQETSKSFTVSGHSNSYLDGTYTCSDSGHYSNMSVQNLFSNASYFNPCRTPHWGGGNSWTTTEHGLIQGPFDRLEYSTSKDGTGQYPYQGFTDANSKFIFHSQACTDGNTYNGTWHRIDFPFEIKPTSFKMFWRDIDNWSSLFVMLGSNDDGATWDYVLGRTSGGNANDITINTTTSNRWKSFKIIHTHIQYKTDVYFTVRQYKLFGDIYA